MAIYSKENSPKLIQNFAKDFNFRKIFAKSGHSQNCYLVPGNGSQDVDLRPFHVQRKVVNCQRNLKAIRRHKITTT